MSKQVIVFAGTMEGREMVQYLLEQGLTVHAAVATEYGESLVEKQEGLTISHERMDVEQMEALIRRETPQLVIDATHPYAAVVTQNVKEATARTGVEYLRLLRSRQEGRGTLQYVDTLEEAVSVLNATKEKALLTTGSKELAAFTKVNDYRERLFARVLSIPSVVAACAELGFEGAHLFCMQGPFSTEMNEAMLRQTSATILVTKDTGEKGGFRQKCEAAAKVGARVLVIGRPLEEEGLSQAECKRACAKIFGFPYQRQIFLVGIGMGNPETMTVQAKRTVEASTLLIGAGRMLEAVSQEGQQLFSAYDPQVIKDYIDQHPEHVQIAIVLSGDVGFYSGAKRLLNILEEPCNLVCGISSMVYFMGKLKRSWEDVKNVSLHGRASNLIGAIRENQKVFTLLGNEDGVSDLCRKLCEYGMGQVQIAYGENLSYENEKIQMGTAESFVGTKTEKLCVCYIENPKAKETFVTHGIEDTAFLRDKVPMTKEEIRSISLSKMRLSKQSVIYDIGAGSGSVSVEAALMASEGQVYAVEKKPEAVELIGKNKRKFCADNLQIVEGLAPEAMKALPVPTHAFIGGSSGNMREIVALLLEKNPQIRIVINAITLETILEALDVVQEFELLDVDIAQVSVAKSKEIGPYHMMMGQNPVTIISCSGGVQ